MSLAGHPSQPAENRGSITEGVAEQYARLWEQGKQNLDDFLRQAGPLPEDSLVSVLRIDQHYRWELGEACPAEDYVRRLPAVGTDDEAAADLVYNEYLIRALKGDAPRRDEFATRFPALAALVEKRVALHEALENLQSACTTPPSEGSTMLPKAAAGPLTATVASPGEVVSRALGRYRILQQLGRGGMGTVYLAYDSQLDRQVALKVRRVDRHPSPEAGERFRREARAAAAVRHAGICPVFDVGEVEGTDYLTMAYISGETLSFRLRRVGMLPTSEACRIISRVADAMEAAHRAGVVHRDLKPSNILLDESGEPVVSDFGLARRITIAEPRLTDAGTMIGTAGYLPPEQVKGELNAAGPRSDIYSLAVILYECLAGKTPFSGSSTDLLRQVMFVEPKPPSHHRPGIDPRLDRLCLKALAKDPANRFGSMAEVGTQLREIMAGPVPTPPNRRLALWIAIVALAALAALIGITGWQWYHWRSTVGDSSLLPVGSRWLGTFRFQGMAGAGAVELVITERTRGAFGGIYTTDGTYSWDVAGTLSDESPPGASSAPSGAESVGIEWRLEKSRTAAAEEMQAAGQAVVRGRLTGDVIEGEYHDHDSKATLSLKLAAPAEGG